MRASTLSVDSTSSVAPDLECEMAPYQVQEGCQVPLAPQNNTVARAACCQGAWLKSACGKLSFSSLQENSRLNAHDLAMSRPYRRGERRGFYGRSGHVTALKAAPPSHFSSRTAGTACHRTPSTPAPRGEECILGQSSRATKGGPVVSHPKISRARGRIRSAQVLNVVKKPSVYVSK